MKKILILAFFVAILSPVKAQKRAAKEILDQVYSRVENGDAFAVNFVVESSSVGQNQGSTTGILLLKGDRFTCETEEMKTWYNGRTQWSLIFDSEEVNVTEPTNEELLEINPYALLKLYKKGYSYTLKSKSRIEEKTLAEVELRAKSKDKDLQKLILWINVESNEPNAIDVVRKNGDQMHINILSVEEKRGNMGIELFTYNPKMYPNVDIIDLR